MNHWRAIASVLVFLVGVATMQAQQQAPTATRLSFEVVSIKPNNSRSGSSSSGYRPGGVYIATNVSLRSMILEAYHIRGFQLEGGPNWADTDRYDVQARPETVPTSGEELLIRITLMLQSMLEDRFQLKIHRETRELPIYALVVARGGPKLTAAAEVKEGCGARGGPMCPGTSMSCCKDGMMDLNAVSVSLLNFAETLSQTVGRQVIDKTDLKGTFDIKLQWLRQDVTPVAGELSGPSIFTAVQEQLGLRLESTKGPVEVIIVDSAQKPAEN